MFCKPGGTNALAARIDTRTVPIMTPGHLESHTSLHISHADILASLGWDADLEARFNERAETGESPARISRVNRGTYSALVVAPDGSIGEVELKITGAFSYRVATTAELPAVGDWVLARLSWVGADTAGDGQLISSVLPRKSAFARRAAGRRPDAQILAANVDLALIIAAAGRDWNPRRIERYIALARDAGVGIAIVLTKMDLAADRKALVQETLASVPGIPVLPVCALDGEGIESIVSFLGKGRTAVLLGSSGAGKSTLLNALAGSELSATGAVRSDDERGRHTTTSRNLYLLGSGALLIDTPGLREVQLWADEDAVDASFADIEELSASCRFRDCRHENEPGCALREALDSGSLDRRRYDSWRKLRREAAHLERKVDIHLAQAESERWKAINKSMRGYSKERRSIQGSSR